MSASARPSALFLTPEAPYPIEGGGRFRSASLLEYLGRKYDLDVIAFREPGAPDPALSLPTGLARRVLVLGLSYHSRRPLARAARNLRRFLRGIPPLNDRFAGFDPQIQRFIEGRQYDLALIEHFWCVPYFAQLAPHSRKVALDLHNVESVLLGRQAEVAGFPAAQLLRRFQAASRELERLWLPRFAVLLAAAETDAGVVRGMAPGTAVHVYPNALPLLDSPVVPEEHVVAFSGNFGYQPNIDAVRYFRGQIWPLLRQRWPELVWRLIGKNPEAVSKYIQGDPRIQATGHVANALESLASAQVAVVPVRAASGTRVKILEAWAASRPVVSTRVGAEGLPILDGETALLADAPEHFAAAVTSLLESAESRRRMGRLGRGLYEREFTWDAAWSRLAEAGL